MLKKKKGKSLIQSPALQYGYTFASFPVYTVDATTFPLRNSGHKSCIFM